MDEHPDDLAAIGRRILARLDLAQCTGCKRTIVPAPHPHPVLCLRCTEGELGITAGENAARIAAGWTIKRWLSRPVDDPWPAAKASSFRRRVFGAGHLGG